MLTLQSNTDGMKEECEDGMIDEVGGEKFVRLAFGIGSLKYLYRG